MKKLSFFTFTFLLLSILLFNSCKKDSNESTENQQVNAWITGVMHDVYYWTTDVPETTWDASSNLNPINYFQSLLVADDAWSYITDDYDALLVDLNGTPLSLGYFPVPGRFTDTDMMFVVVAYVYANSPAANAGLERGDIILKINDTQLTVDNYYKLIYTESAKLTLGYTEGDYIYLSDETVSMDAEVIHVNPALAYQVIEDSGKKVGYLAISEFTAYDNFIAGLTPALADFKAAGIDDMVVDLRYNLGGSVDAAVWLASALVDANSMENQSLLTSLQFNNYLQVMYQNDNSTKYYFEPNAYNLDLDRIYFLTSYYSASASELVISGLLPYIAVTTIGETTRGKYVGSSLFPQPNQIVSHNYGMLPIMFAYANASGEKVKNGIIPEFNITDDILASLPFGDTGDPMLAKALELITGVKKSATQSAADYTRIEKMLTPKQIQKMQLIIASGK